MLNLDKNLDIKTLTANKTSITLKPLNCKGEIVDYTLPSQGRTVFIKSLGIFVSPFLVKGNAKLDKGILIFDLLAVGSCGNCSTCEKSCYALKSQIQYTGTYNKRAVNTFMVKHEIENLELSIHRQLEKSTEKIVRVHSSGDFMTQGEVDMWGKLAWLHHDKKFYAYTKMDKILDFSKLIELENFNIINSILKNGEKNYGTMSDFRQAKLENPGLKLCSYGIGPKNKMAHCGTTCKKCLKYDRMYFIEH
ncbi:MAG: hypothetical protein GY799_21080 [Desulfobulbaceae bacterium]|nr:hypothetical protein [Desulfobulbaceae bacterium]